MFLPWDVILLRLVIAGILTSVIGLEREFRHKPVGFRTNMLVGMGATLIMLVSLTFDADQARIAASIITGIGFLGAGLIIQSRGQVHGITTAASIWVVAAIGMAVGIGYYTAAVIATLLSLVILLLFGNEKLRDKMKLDV